MRITFLSVSDGLGGSEVALLEMVQALRRLRPSWPLHVILPGHGPLLPRVEAAGATGLVVPLPNSIARVGESAVSDAGWSLAARAALGARLCGAAAAWPGYRRQLRRTIDTCRPDVLHTNGLKAHVLAARMAVDAAIVWHMHEYVAGRPLTRVLLNRYANRCRAAFANSVSVANDVRAAVPGMPPATVIYNAVDLSVFSPDGDVADLDTLAGLPPAPPGTVRVGLVATFARWKGHETFFRAVAELPGDVPVRAYVIGGSVYATAGSQHSRQHLESMAVHFGIRDRLGFTGFVPSAGAMRALDVVVHASTRPEPFGLVIAEAMACGRAVITSATGGAAELIEPGQTALTHSPGNPKDLARCVASLTRDPALRRQLGARARAVAEQRFNAGRLASDLVAAYDALSPAIAARVPA